MGVLQNFTLSQNMRLGMTKDSNDRNSLASFASWILAVGNGELEEMRGLMGWRRANPLWDRLGQYR